MKKFKFLFLIPAIFSMVACGLGKEVDSDKAKEVAKNMKAETPKAMEVSLTISEYDADEKASGKSTYTVKQNDNGEIYASIKGESTGKNAEKVDMEIYRVKDEEYEEVIYAKRYDEDSKKDEITVVTKKDNPIAFTTTYAAAEGYLVIADSYEYDASELVALLESAEMQAKADENITFKYYSKGDNNLTIKETIKKGDDDEKPYGESTITFDKGLMASMESKMQNGKGDKMEIKATFKYPSSLKISLPSNWKDNLSK